MHGKRAGPVVLLALVVAGAGGWAQANDRLGSHLQLHYSQFDEAENEGFGIAGSWRHDRWRVFGEYTRYDFNELAIFGGGFAVIDDGDLQAELGLGYQDVELAEDGAVGAHLVVNHPLTPATHLSGKLGYLVYDDIADQPLLGVGIEYRYNDEISAFANFENQTERRALLFRLGLRWSW